MYFNINIQIFFLIYGGAFPRGTIGSVFMDNFMAINWDFIFSDVSV